MSGEHRILVATMAILVLVAASATSLVVGETRRQLAHPLDLVSHSATIAAVQQDPTTGHATTAGSAPTYQLCPDGSVVPTGGACPVHHTRQS